MLIIQRERLAVDTPDPQHPPMRRDQRQRGQHRGQRGLRLCQRQRFPTVEDHPPGHDDRPSADDRLPNPPVEQFEREGFDERGIAARLRQQRDQGAGALVEQGDTTGVGAQQLLRQGITAPQQRAQLPQREQLRRRRAQPTIGLDAAVIHALHHVLVNHQHRSLRSILDRVCCEPDRRWSRGTPIPARRVLHWFIRKPKAFG